MNNEHAPKYVTYQKWHLIVCRFTKCWCLHNAHAPASLHIAWLCMIEYELFALGNRLTRFSCCYQEMINQTTLKRIPVSKDTTERLKHSMCLAKRNADKNDTIRNILKSKINRRIYNTYTLYIQCKRHSVHTSNMAYSCIKLEHRRCNFHL